MFLKINIDKKEEKLNEVEMHQGKKCSIKSGAYLAGMFKKASLRYLIGFDTI